MSTENRKGPRKPIDATSETLYSADSAKKASSIGRGDGGGVAPFARADLFQRGEVLDGTYEILGILGSGGMGQVYEARDRRLNRVVAVKASWPEVGAETLREEAQALAAFRHAGLVAVHALGTHLGSEYLVMERLAGITLADHLEKRRASGGFSLEETLEVLAAVAETLGILHGAGLAHRDLKPENVMLAPKSRVVLLDFGIVRQERHISSEKTISGSPLYMAPESVVAKVKTGEAHLVDVYALGVIAFEMLAGRPPYYSENPTELLLQHVRAPIPRLLDLRPDLPVALEKLVAEMMAKRPDDRPSSIEVVSAVLRSIRGGLSSPAQGKPIDVLIVDDDPDMRRLVQMLVLQSAPTAEVRTASDGEQALRLFHERPPELMFLDLQMPVMNGMEVCMYLRGTSLADRTTIVVVSSFADANQELLEQLGVADVMAKKTRGPQELATKIKSLVQRIESARNRTRPAR